MFRSSAFDKLLDKATSHILMDPDWPSILQICDQIRQNDVQPKTAIAGIKKKLHAENPHTALYALTVLESMMKNCGPAVHEELTTKINCDYLYELVKSTQHQLVRQKLLDLIQAWNHALRNNPKHANLKTLISTLKEEGFKFPTLRESDAMFAADSAPEWMDGDNCHRCRATFGLVNRKHHCRNCGQVFCGNCSAKTISLPKFGIEKEVRVCDTCYDAVTRPTSVSKDKEELPAEYLKSSLSQQNQEPPRKNEDELREEEELNLALALSQSEAEAKEKEKLKITSTFHNTYANNKVETKPERSPSPQDEVNPEMARYLNRSYWESLNLNDNSDSQRATSPTAPVQNNEIKYKFKENGVADNNLEEFIKTLKSQVEIFINRMKSNSSRGRSIANDTSVQSLFMNITAMHSQLLRYIQQHDDSRLHYERLQDKLTQVKDARAALDALREEHRDKLRREAEEAERQRQLQMAHKLEIMRKKKQEYLQYQRQLALQRIQEQEREMQMRQEQQKQQYLMGSQYGYIGSPVHGQPFPPPPHQNPQMMSYGQYPYTPQMMPGQPPQMPPGGMPSLPHQPPPGMPMGHPPGFQGPPPNNQQFVPPGGQMPPLTSVLGMTGSNSGLPVGNQPNPGSIPQQNNPGIPGNMMMPPNLVQTPSSMSVNTPNMQAANNPPNIQQFQAPPQPAQDQIKKEEAQTGELISFD